MSESHWALRVLRFITKEEVKTPLSFLYKVVPYLIASLIVILYAPISDDLKQLLVAISFAALLTMAAVVLLFAWFRPKHLVYGETGYRAEHKLEFGTETTQRTEEEIEVLDVGSDPRLPRIEIK